jgi:hypothetical protein
MVELLKEENDIFQLLRCVDARFGEPILVSGKETLRYHHALALP